MHSRPVPQATTPLHRRHRRTMPTTTAASPDPDPTPSGLRQRHHHPHLTDTSPEEQEHPTPTRRRPSLTSTATTALLTTASHLETKLEHALLLLWDDLPAWRRDNPSILRGYRATSNSTLTSFRSLLYLHNESVNIWTHLLGAACFTLCAGYGYLLVAPRYASAGKGDLVVMGCFFGGAACCLGMSAVYHTLCNHSEEVARWGNKLDYSGIVALIVGSYVPALWYGFCGWGWVLEVYLGVVSLRGTSCAW